ncbi:MAG: DNA repair exonuclease [Gemmatimonadota bacterium]|nr:MAG: DNA repair exonuclease [Gemmatimonadota bacterium]
MHIRIVFCADTHLGFDYPIRPKVKRRQRGQDFFENYHRVLSHAIDSQADVLIHGGDLFFRSRVPAKIIDLAYEPLMELADRGFPVFLVPGNHERSNLPPSLFLNHPNIRIFDKPKTYTLDLHGARISLSGFPFEREDIRDRFRALLDATEWNGNSADIKLLCLHQAIEGAQVGPSNYTFQYGKDVIRRNDLPSGVHAVLVGHIHRQQILWLNGRHHGNKIPVIHAGSTERTSFAEKGERKGFYEIRFGTTGDTGWCIEHLRFIEVPTRPMEDLRMPSNLTLKNMRPFILSKIAEFDEHSIVRFQCDRDIDDEVREEMTGRFLRGVFPETMNVQFGSGFFVRNRTQDHNG